VFQNVRGAYFVPTHDRAQDWDFLAKWQPNVIRLMLHGSHSDPASVSVPVIQRVHQTCPDATILLRVWDVDDRNFEAHAAMVANPQAEAGKQLDWWARLFDRVQGVPRTQLMAGLNNETGPEKDGALYPYTERSLTLGTQRAVRLGVFVFSTGRPSLAGEGQAFDVEYFERLDGDILANSGAVLLHEYMQPEGMYAVWTDDQGRERRDYPYLIGRHTNWNIKSPIIIAEWGIEGILYNRHPHPEFGNSGWRNFRDLWPPDRYADEYVECVRQADDNVIATCPYLLDYADRKWASHDLLDAYAQFIARKDLCVRDIASTKPIDTRLPVIISPGPAPATPPPPSIVTGIIEPRVAQAILKVESGGRTHGENGKPLIRFEAHIFKTKLGNDALWAQYFKTDSNRPWLLQEWRSHPDKPWTKLHTGSQGDEYAALSLAQSLAQEAAYQSISMGAGQLMGFNHARLGYSSAQAMFKAFQDAQVQTIGFINFFLSDSLLMEAMHRKDWREIAKRYNGAGAVDTYAPLLEKAYRELG
jgi:hypothetical protein